MQVYKTLMSFNPMSAVAIDYHGITVGKRYLVDDMHFQDDLGRCRYAKAWVFYEDAVDLVRGNRQISLMELREQLPVGRVQMPIPPTMKPGQAYLIFSNMFFDGEGNTHKAADFSWSIISNPKRLEDSIKLATENISQELVNDGILSAEDKVKIVTGALSDNPKKQAGAVKAPMHNLPPTVMIPLANVMAGGEFKYGFYNFRETEIDAQTYMGAIERHFAKWKDGVDTDKESRQPELAHIMACCAILIDAQKTGKFVDNRSKTGLVEGMLEKSAEDFKLFMEENADKKLKV